MILQPEDPRQICFISRAELVAEEPLVLTVGQVVDGLDLGLLYGRYSEAGRSFYDPAMMLKLLFFSYCEGVRSSREIAKRIRYDVRYQYFTGSLRPDFRTINRFRQDNLDLLGECFARIVTLCEQSGLVDVSVLAIDGTKLRASASGKRTISKKKQDQLARQFRAELERDVAGEADDLGDDSDETSPPTPDGVDHEKPLDEELAGSSGDITDPDARFMKTSEGVLRSCYNSQIAVDRNQIIVAADVSMIADDSVQFQGMVQQSRSNVTGDLGEVLVDGGYYSGSNLKHSESAGYDLYIPLPQANRVPDRRFEREAFEYDKATDSYRCPGGKQLSYSHTRSRSGITRRVYRGSVSICGSCQLRSRCTKKRCRELNISEVYHLERRMRQKMSSEPGRAKYDQRKGLVEAVFGNLKFNLGFTRFHLRTLPKVRGEFLLMCIAHNLKKLTRYGVLFGPVQTAAQKALYAAISWLLRLYYRLQDELSRNLGQLRATRQSIRQLMPT